LTNFKYLLWRKYLKTGEWKIAGYYKTKKEAKGEFDRRMIPHKRKRTPEANWVRVSHLILPIIYQPGKDGAWNLIEFTPKIVTQN